MYLSELTIIEFSLNKFLISFIVNSGFKVFKIDINQTTCGVAIEVPLKFLYVQFKLVE